MKPRLLHKQHIRGEPKHSLTSSRSAGASISLTSAHVHPRRPRAFVSLQVFERESNETGILHPLKEWREMHEDTEDTQALPVEAAETKT